MESIDKNKKILMALSAVGLAGAGLYFLVKTLGVSKREEQKEKTLDQQHCEEILHVNFAKDANYTAGIENLKIMLKNQSGGTLSKNFLIAINKAIIQLMKNEFISTFVMIRNARRSLLTDLEKYAEFVVGSMSETDRILDQASAEVFADLGIDGELVEAESERIAEEDPQFSVFMLYMIESAKSAIPSKRSKPVILQDVIAFYEHQIKTLEKSDFTHLNDIDHEMRIQIKQTYILDRAALDLNIEEEDLMRNPQLMMANQQLMQLQNKLQSLLIRA